VVIDPLDSQDDGLEISATRLKRRLDNGDALHLIDVREKWEWDLANLESFGARLMPMSTVPQHVDELDPAEEIVVYCRSGARSMRVLQYLYARGFERVKNLQGGLLAWSNEVDPTFPQY
jgi:adenylyltransferase/sulfurtransferase